MMLSNLTSAAPVKIIYVYDALCGWCFGFSPVIAKIADAYKDQLQVEVLSGGLRVGEAVGTIDEVAPYIKTAYKDVEMATGVKFGSAFIEKQLQPGTMRLNSLPPAMALTAIKEKYPTKALTAASLLHKMIYVEVYAPEDTLGYIWLSKALDISSDYLLAALQDSVVLQKTLQEFQQCVTLGGTSFPTVLLQKNDGTTQILLKGFVTEQELKKRIAHALKN